MKPHLKIWIFILICTKLHTFIDLLVNLNPSTTLYIGYTHTHIYIYIYKYNKVGLMATAESAPLMFTGSCSRHNMKDEGKWQQHHLS